MVKAKKQKRISYRLIVYIILFSSMITGIITIIQLYHQYTDDKKMLENQIENVKTGYREGIINAVWLDDKVQLLSILDGVVALPDIEYIEVLVNNKIYASTGEIVNSNTISSSFTLERMHDNRLLTIGKTNVIANYSAIYQRLYHSAWHILGLNAIKTSIVAIFMYFMFNRLVVSRLVNLSNHVRQYDTKIFSDNPEFEPIDDQAHTDEITDITTAINTMQIHLSHSIRELLQFKKTLDLSLDGFFMFQPDTYQIFYSNEGASLLLGYSPKELMQMTPMDISNDLNESLFKKLSAPNADKDNRAIDIETIFKPKYGNPIPVRLFLQYLNPENEEPRYIFTARDTSEQIRAQREIQKSLEEAKAANAELESFSYSVSHDLRTPLRAIDGFSLLLAQDYGEKVDEEGKNYIRRVRKSAQRMGNLIDDMLSLSRVTRGELRRDTHNISEMANNTIKKLQEYEPDRKVEVIIKPNIHDWVDKRLFETLLDNLLGNAWKYTCKTDHAQIEFGKLMQNHNPVYYVRDNGAGFDNQYSDKLFKAFQRLHSDEEFSGTGIGLATVSRILARHGGHVWAESEIGKGATFYFSLRTDRFAQEI